jgi:hypothetical protein
MVNPRNSRVRLHLGGVFYMLTRQRLIVLLALFTVSANAGPLVYIVSAGITGAGQFGTVDLTTGAFQQIGPLEPDGYFGLAPGPNGALLSLTYAGNLDSINPATGVPTRIGATGLGACVIPSPSCGPTSAFSLGTVDGKIYATDFQNDLYGVNPLTGAATLLSNATGLPASPFFLGSQNPDGTLNFADEAIWGSAGYLYITYDAITFDLVTGQDTSIVIAPKLYRVDPSTGLAIVIGPTDVGIGGATVVNGTTYAFNDLTGQIATLDLSTGTTNPTGYFDPSAGVIQGASPTPEPESLALAGIGIVALVISRRRRRYL